MSLLNYSHTLVAGTPENVNDVQDMFNDVRTLVNGNLDATNLASGAKPADLMGAYRQADSEKGFSQGGNTAGVYILSGTNSFKTGTTFGLGTIVAGAPGIVYLDPAAYAVTGLTTKGRLACVASANAVAPAITFTFGLYPVTGSGGTAGDYAISVGTVVTGSTVALAPGAAGNLRGVSSDFALPTAGIYAFAVALSGTQAANSNVALIARFEVRNV